MQINRPFYCLSARVIGTVSSLERILHELPMSADCAEALQVQIDDLNEALLSAQQAFLEEQGCLGGQASQN